MAATEFVGLKNGFLPDVVYTDLNTRYTRKWRANTAYAAGEYVTLPTGIIGSAKVNFTSGATYDPANWNIPTVTAGVSGTLDLSQAPYNADPADIGPAIAQALADSSGTKQLLLPGGTWNWLTSVSYGASVNLRGDGIGKTIVLAKPNVQMLSVTGSAGYTLTLAADIAAGARTISVSDATGVAVGDVLNIRSLKIWPGSETTTGSGKNGRYGEMVQVYSISGTTITLTGLTAYAYATADTVTIEKQNLVNGVTVRDMTFRNPSPNTGGNGHFAFKRVANVSISNVMFEKPDGPGFSGTLVWGLSAHGVIFKDGSEQFSSSRYSYGFDMRDACRGWVIANCHMYGGRHLFTCNSYGVTGSTSFGIPRGASIVNCIGADCYEAPFDTHEEGDDISFIGCRVESSRAFPWQIRAPRTKLVGCSSSGMQVGPIVRKTATNWEIKDYTALDVKTGSAGTPAGIQLEAGCPSGEINGLIVIGSDAAAVLVGSGSERQVIRNVTARNANRTTGNGAVEFLGTSSGHAVQNVVAMDSPFAVYGPATVTACSGDALQIRGSGSVIGGAIGITLISIPNGSIAQAQLTTALQDKINGGAPGSAAQRGLLGVSIDPEFCTSTFGLTATRVFYQRITVQQAANAGYITVQVQTAGASLTGAVLVLCDQNGTEIARTGDLSTAWTSTGYKEHALASAVAVTPGVYYVAALVASATTSPAMKGGSSAAPNFGFSAAPGMTNYQLGGQSNVPSTTTPTAWTLNTGSLLVGVKAA